MTVGTDPGLVKKGFHFHRRFVLAQHGSTDDISKKYANTRNCSNQNRYQPSKPKREITNITNSQNTKRTYGQPSEQLFPKRWPLRNRNRTKNNMNTHKVKHHRNSDTKNRQQRTTKTAALERSENKMPPFSEYPNITYLFSIAQFQYGVCKARP